MADPEVSLLDCVIPLFNPFCSRRLEVKPVWLNSLSPPPVWLMRLEVDDRFKYPSSSTSSSNLLNPVKVCGNASVPPSNKASPEPPPPYKLSPSAFVIKSVASGVDVRSLVGLL